MTGWLRVRILSVTLVIAVVVLGVGCASAPPQAAAPDRSLTPAKSARSADYPACFTNNVSKASRFADPDYFRWLAGDGLRSAPANGLYDVMKRSAELGENYKALYFARLLTTVAPDQAGAWTNRARLAGSVGLAVEQQICAERASNLSSVRPIPHGFLPGAISLRRPVSLGDWAAAMILMSDDSAEREGPAGLIAAKNDISGIDQLVDMSDEERKPRAVGKPLGLNDLLPNLFVLVDAHPMEEHNTNGGMLALGILASALSGVNASYGNAAGAQAASKLSGHAMADAFSVASHYKNGSYVARTYAADAAKNLPQKPRTAGEFDVVGTPLPILWASGGASSPTFRMRLAKSNGKAAKVYASRFSDGPIGKRQEMRIPDLLFPRLASLCLIRQGDYQGQAVSRAEDCTVGLSASELLLRPQDLSALVPDGPAREKVLRLSLDLSPWDGRYRNGGSEIAVNPGNGTSDGWFVGYDESGTCYQLGQGPDHWFTAVIGGSAPERAASR